MKHDLQTPDNEVGRPADLAGDRGFGIEGRPIDTGIKPLVDAMNATGMIRTVASCEGHADGCRAPYVYFQAPVQLASDIEQLLRLDAMSNAPVLGTEWVVEGRFDANFELAFRLHSRALGARAESVFGPGHHWFGRRRMRADFTMLIAVVTRAARMQAGGDECRSALGDVGSGRACAARNFALRAGAMAALSAAMLCASSPSRADGFAPGDPANVPEQVVRHVKTKSIAKPAHQSTKRDALAVDPAVAVKDEPQKAVDLPGVMKLDGANRDILDPTRVRQIHLSNGASQTTYVSATQPNRIQLPFVNPKVIATDDIDIDKSPVSNNVYVTFKNAVPTAVQVWIEPKTGSSVAVGLQLVPKTIPAQSIVVVDDTVQGSAGRDRRASAESEYLTRTQAVLEEAAFGASPLGYAAVDLQVPAMSVNGVVIEGVRRLSGRGDDIYVYGATNPGGTDVQLQEKEFDGPDVRAVSILPRPLLHPGERAVVTVLAKKREGN